MTAQSRLEEIRAEHPSAGHTCPTCREYRCDDGNYAPAEEATGPCAAAVLLSRIARLEAVAAAARQLTAEPYSASINIRSDEWTSVVKTGPLDRLKDACAALEAAP